MHRLRPQNLFSLRAPLLLGPAFVCLLGAPASAPAYGAVAASIPHLAAEPGSDADRARWVVSRAGRVGPQEDPRDSQAELAAVHNAVAGPQDGAGVAGLNANAARAERDARWAEAPAAQSATDTLEVAGKAAAEGEDPELLRSDTQQSRGVAVEKRPLVFALQRQEYGWWTHFLLHDESGALSGLVERRHWRQPWRRSYEAQDTDGQHTGKAGSPWLSLGNFFSWQAELYLQNARQENLGHLKGRILTLRAATYALYNAAGDEIGQALVDDRGQSVVVQAAASKRVVATFLREQQGTRGCDRWNVRVEMAGFLPADAWPLLVAFFADVWTDLARSYADG